MELVGKSGHPVESGAKALRNTAQGRGQHFFDNAGRKLKVGAGDTIFAYAYLDPKDPPKELMLQWHTRGNWTHRAYWGSNLIDWGTDGTPERLRMGDLPPAGRWVRLEVPVAKLKLKKGEAIDGWAFTQFDGTVYWDKAGIVTEAPQDGQLYDCFADWAGGQRALRGAGLPDNIKKAVLAERSKRSQEQTRELLAYFIEHAYAKTAGDFEPLRERGRAGGAQAQGHRRPGPDDARLSREGGRAQAGVHAQAGRIRPER